MMEGTPNDVVTTVSTWTVDERALELTHPDVLSSIFCVGNGAHCTRGTLSEERLGGYRGTYLSGLFTRAGYGLVYFLCAPDWLPATVRVDGKVVPCVETRRVLDMREGVLRREAVFSAQGTLVQFCEERFASWDRPELAAQRVEVTVVAATGQVEAILAVDGEVRNHQAKYYVPGQLPNCEPHGLKLSEIESLVAGPEGLRAVVHSRQTGRRAACAARVRQVAGPDAPVSYATANGWATAAFSMAPGETYVFDKVCALAGDVPGYQQAADIDRLFTGIAGTDYASARAAHTKAVAQFWAVADVEIVGDPVAQQAVRYALWSTRSAAANDGGASSLGAKNISGDWYRGATFWDMEIFQLPMLTAIAPERARNHILYRARRLDSARTLAAQDGYRGARFPWQSYSSGLEDPPVIGGFLYMQQHLNAAVGWGILHYFSLTGDRETMLDAGLEVLLELGNFWASRVQVEDDGRFYIRNVCGPDEVHQGIDDNAYTNRMVSFQLKATVDLLGWLEDSSDSRLTAALTKTGVDAATRAQWLEIAEKLYVPMIPGTPVMAQFAGFEGYAEPNERLREEAGHGQDKTNKQADTLLLFQNLPSVFSQDELAVCWREYAPLCNQTSSLSLCTHALLAIRQGLARDARRLFEAAAGVDLADTMGNTCEGIHGAGEGGIWQAIVNGYGGLTVRHGSAVDVDPMLPEEWESLKYSFLLEGQQVEVLVGQGRVVLTNRGTSDVSLTLSGVRCHLKPGERYEAAQHAAWKAQELEGVIFDLDGVLVRTDHLHFLAWKSLADELGLPFDEQVNHRLRGVSREESLRRIYDGRPLPSDEEFAAQCARKNARYVELVQQMGPQDVLPGAIDLLQALRAAGIKCAVASASKNAEVVLQRTGLAGYLDAVIDGTMVTASKPDPQGFYLAAQHLRVLPWNCMGVEDAASGVEAIHRAGMLAVGVGDQTAAAELQVPATSDISVAMLRDLYRSRENHTNPYLERNVAKMVAERGTYSK